MLKRSKRVDKGELHIISRGLGERFAKRYRMFYQWVLTFKNTAYEFDRYAAKTAGSLALDLHR